MLRHIIKSIKSLTLILFTIVILSCISSDKSKTEIQFNKDNLYSSILVNQLYDFEGLRLNLVVLDVAKGFFRDLINSIAVDREESAYDYLLKNFYIAYISIENTTKSQMIFDTNSFYIITDKVVLKPIMKENLPDKLKRFNVKGTMKNIYNAGVVCAVTSFIVLAVVGCAKGKCGGMNYIGDVFNISQSGETDPQKLFSSFIHKTKIQYNDLLDKENKLEPGQKAEGIVFFEKRTNTLNSLIRIFYNKRKKIELKRI